MTVMIQRFDRIEAVLETKADKVDLDRAIDTLDAVMKRQEECEIERLAMGHQMNRTESWIEQAADKIDLKFV